MASTDARPIPIKNTAYRVTFPILDADGDLVTGATGLDSEVSIDGGTFADCTNEATEIATSSGVYYLDLTSGEMNGDTVALIIKTSSSGAKTTVLVLYPNETGDIDVDVTAFGGSAGTFASGRPEVNTSHIAGSAVSTSSAQIGVNVVQVSGDATAADNAEAFFDGTGYAGTNNVIPTVTTVTNLTNAPTNGDLTATMKASVNTEVDTALSDYGALKPTTAGRTLDVTATGEAGIDWANVGSPTTTLNLSGTTIKTATDVETDTANIQTRIPTALTANGEIKADTQRILTLVPSDYLDQALNPWVSLMVRKDAGINVDFGTQYALINQNNGSGAGTYNNTTDSQEALRDNIGTNGAALSLAKTTNITGFNDLSAAQVNAEADTALSDVGLTTTVTGRIDAAVSTRATPAQVNTEVVDALATDTYAEPGQGAPAATASLAAKINYLYKSWRNKKTNDGSTTKLYADDGATVDQKQTTGESGGTVTKEEWVTGP